MRFLLALVALVAVSAKKYAFRHGIRSGSGDFMADAEKILIECGNDPQEMSRLAQVACVCSTKCGAHAAVIEKKAASKQATLSATLAASDFETLATKLNKENDDLVEKVREYDAKEADAQAVHESLDGGSGSVKHYNKIGIKHQIGAMKIKEVSAVHINKDGIKHMKTTEVHAVHHKQEATVETIENSKDGQEKSNEKWGVDHKTLSDSGLNFRRLNAVAMGAKAAYEKAAGDCKKGCGWAAAGAKENQLEVSNDSLKAGFQLFGITQLFGSSQLFGSDD